MTLPGKNPTETISFGSTELRIRRQKDGWAGIVVGRANEPHFRETREELIETLKTEAARQTGDFIGYPAAIRRFCARHPQGFRDPSYAKMERDDKDTARKLLDETASIDAALEADGLAAQVARVFTAPSFQLINRFQADRARAMLKSSDGDAYLRAAARFCTDPTGTHLEAMRRIATSHDARTWPIITLLPWLWAPGRHVFIKPEETKAFARSVGHTFHLLYAIAEPLEIYDAARDLGQQILRETADLGSRDFIDTQGFIYVVCHPELQREE